MLVLGATCGHWSGDPSSSLGVCFLSWGHPDSRALSPLSGASRGACPVKGGMEAGGRVEWG